MNLSLRRAAARAIGVNLRIFASYTFLQPKKIGNTLRYCLSFLRVIDEKDTKLKADDLSQKRMFFHLSGFNFYVIT